MCDAKLLTVDEIGVLRIDRLRTNRFFRLIRGPTSVGRQSAYTRRDQ